MTDYRVEHHICNLYNLRDELIATVEIWPTGMAYEKDPPDVIVFRDRVFVPTPLAMSYREVEYVAQVDAQHIVARRERPET